MLSVKIPLDWYLNSPTTIVLYFRMYMCKVFPSSRQKLKKNAIYMKEVLHRLRHFDVGKQHKSLRHVKPILGKIHVT